MNHFEALAKTAARSRRTIPGTAVRFKSDRWWGENDNDIKGQKLIALMLGLLDGWRRWPKGEPPIFEVGPAIDVSFIPLARNQLDENDREDWPAGMNGLPEDPWKRCYVLPMCDATGKLFNFFTDTIGGRNSIDDLINEYVAAGPTKGDGMLPVVELAVRKYQSKYGQKAAPLFTIVDWAVPPASVALPSVPTAAPQIEPPPKPREVKPKQPVRAEVAALLAAKEQRGDMDDEIPF